MTNDLRGDAVRYRVANQRVEGDAARLRDQRKRLRFRSHPVLFPSPDLSVPDAEEPREIGGLQAGRYARRLDPSSNQRLRRPGAPLSASMHATEHMRVRIVVKRYCWLAG